MRRVSAYEFTAQETTMLKLTQAAAEIEQAAHRVKHRGVVQCLGLGLPVRVIGGYADYSGAQVSRIGTGKQVL